MSEAPTPLSPATSPAPTNRRGIGIGRSILLCVVFYAVIMAGSFLAGIIFGIAAATGGDRISPTDPFGLVAIPQIIAWIVTILLGLQWLGGSFRETSRLKPFPARIVPAVLIASLGAAILLIELAGWIPMPESWREAAIKQREASNPLILLLPVVIVAPLAEEIFFRSLVLRGYLERYSVTKSIWASAILFALFHLNPWQAVIALPLGVWYAHLVLRTGSVLPGIISHAMVNFSHNFLVGPLAILLGSSTDDMRQWRHYPASLLVVGAALVAIGAALLRHQLAKIPPPQPVPDRTPTQLPGTGETPIN